MNDTYKYLPQVDGYYPKLSPNNPTPPPPPFAGTYFCHLLPFIEQGPLYKQFQPSPGGAGGGVGAVNTSAVKTYLCPSDYTSSGTGTTANGSIGAVGNYAINPLVFGIPTYPAIPRTFQDGTSNTIIFAEVLGDCATTGAEIFNEWGASSLGDATAVGAALPDTVAATPIYNASAPPGGVNAGGTPTGFQVQPVSNTTNGTCTPGLAQTPHTGGMQVSLGDASVRALNTGVSALTFLMASDPRDGNPLPSDWNQ
jgi:hypothetical protein